MRRPERQSVRRFVSCALLAAASAGAAPSPQVPLPGAAIPQFVEPLPTLSIPPWNGPLHTIVANSPTAGGALTLSLCEFKSHVLPTGTLTPGLKPETWVWGYVPGTECPASTTVRESYLGPLLVNFRGKPTEITFINQLGTAASTNVLAYRYSTDQTLHWADPLGGEQNLCAMVGGIPGFGSFCAQNYAGPIPAAVHLHGGEVPPEIDGGPDAWFTNALPPWGAIFGHGYYTKANPLSPAPINSAVYAYPNTQQAAPIWFHDHALGATRLNVYAGLAGGYYVIDPAQTFPAGFPDVTQVVPVILQDRMFDTTGQLYFPADSSGGILNTPNPEHPYWVPEFVGDTIVVNGKAWPYFSAEPRRYRFLFLNGSNARTYELFLDGVGAPSIWVIGNDGGYLDSAVKLDPALGQKLVIMPGERYEVVVDFAAVAPGTSLILRNTGKTPYPAGKSPQGSTTGRVMQFRIACGAGGCPMDASWNPAVSPAIRAAGQKTVRLASGGALAPGVAVNKTRQLTLNEVMGMPLTAIDPVTGVSTAYPGGPLEILVNNTKWAGESSRPYGDFAQIVLKGFTMGVSERPLEGTTEVWEIVNLTADAHPIHTHLASFQVLNRQGINTNKYTKAYAAAFPRVPGDPVCLGGVFCPGFGPPLHYETGNTRALGGNPDVTPFLQGPVKPALPQESGWKDTVLAPPGAVTRFVIRWGPNDVPVGTAATFPFDPGGVSPNGDQRGYVWHCHIIDHEDNEMMRPDVIQTDPLTPRTIQRGIDF